MSAIIDSPESYFSQRVPPRDDLLLGLELEAARERIPIVGPVVGEWLHILAKTANARRILDLGSATGYSAIVLGRACAANGGRVLSLELDAEMSRRARENIARAGLQDVVAVLTGDALAQMAGLEGPFDMIFMDIEKRDYSRALPACERLLRENGLLVADNTAFRDADAFNREIHASPCWRSVNLYLLLPGHSPERDGVCLALRTGETAREPDCGEPKPSEPAMAHMRG
jgi:predicted O-methyltransferase YrrM